MVKLTSWMSLAMSANDPKRTFEGLRSGRDFKTGFSAQILHASALMACSHYVGYTSASGFFRSSNTGYTHEINLVTYVRKSLGFFP